jgi:hypothetical protein
MAKASLLHKATGSLAHQTKSFSLAVLRVHPRTGTEDMHGAWLSALESSRVLNTSGR